MSVIPATWEVEMGGLWFKASLDKVSETLSQKTSQAWWYTSVIPAIWEVKLEGSW
jgi:hypothetical protein